MKSTIKWLSMGISLIALIGCAFAAGAYFRPSFWIDTPALYSSETVFSGVGPFYTTDNFARANMQVDDFLRVKLREPRYSHLDLKYLVTPETSGYSTHKYVSLRSVQGGFRLVSFPKELEAEAGIVVQNALNNK